jgi:hypothetical protein
LNRLPPVYVNVAPGYPRDYSSRHGVVFVAQLIAVVEATARESALDIWFTIRFVIWSSSFPFQIIVARSDHNSALIHRSLHHDPC